MPNLSRPNLLSMPADVSQNKLVALPEDVLHLMTDLEVLNAFRNSFTTLPDLTPLQSLTVLNFGCDFFSSPLRLSAYPLPRRYTRVPRSCAVVSSLYFPRPIPALGAAAGTTCRRCHPRFVICRCNDCCSAVTGSRA